MRLFRTLVAALIGAGLAATPALADPPRDQERAWEATREGRAMPLPKIEQRVMPFMGGADYLGPEFIGGVYRLKFMRDGRVIWSMSTPRPAVSSAAPGISIAASAQARS